MQGINKTQHRRLADALLQPEKVYAGMERRLELNGATAMKAVPTSTQMKAKRLELEESYAQDILMLRYITTIHF